MENIIKFKDKLKCKDYVLKLIQKEMQTLKYNEMLDFAFILINELDLDIDNDSEMLLFNQYLEKWNSRNVQTKNHNFYLPFETTIVNFYLKNENILDFKISNILSNDLYKIIKSLDSYKNDPTIFNFINFNKDNLNFNILKLMLNIIKITYSKIQNSYGLSYEMIDIEKMIDKFLLDYKYQIMYIDKYNFYFRNDTYFAKESNKIYFSVEELIILINHIIFILDKFITYIPNRVKEILDFDFEN